MSDSLEFKETYENTLKQEIQNTLNATSVNIGRQFESWDSFAFLVTTDNDKQYVAKIFRFPEWPPPMKLDEVSRILIHNQIPHENILHIIHEHPVFKYGWQLSEYISGGTAKEALDNRHISYSDYYEKIGKVLRQVHTIELDFHGSVHDKHFQYESFKDLVHEELNNQKFDELTNKYSTCQKTINEVKQRINEYININDNFTATLVHDDVGSRNVLWNNGNPILIDWVDSVVGPPIRDFATVTFREDKPILNDLEKGYGKHISRSELKLHQLMRFLRLGHFYYYEDKDYDEFELMMQRAELLLNNDTPFGA